MKSLQGLTTVPYPFLPNPATSKRRNALWKRQHSKNEERGGTQSKQGSQDGLIGLAPPKTNMDTQLYVYFFFNRWLLFNIAIFDIYLSNFRGLPSQHRDFSEGFRLFQVVVNGHPGHRRTRGTLHGPKKTRDFPHNEKPGSSWKWGEMPPYWVGLFHPINPFIRPFIGFFSPFINGRGHLVAVSLGHACFFIGPKRNGRKKGQDLSWDGNVF